MARRCTECERTHRQPGYRAIAPPAMDMSSRGAAGSALLLMQRRVAHQSLEEPPGILAVAAALGAEGQHVGGRIPHERIQPVPQLLCQRHDERTTGDLVARPDE